MTLIRDGRRVLGWVTLVAGLGASAAAVGLAVQSASPPADAGELPAAQPAASAPAMSATREPIREQVQEPPPWAAPSRIRIAGLRVDVPVQAAGVRPDRALDVPEDPERLGWWIGSATPGSPRGTVLVAGHVDTAEDGPGALFRLETLPMGARIEVRAGDRTVTYRAVARRSYDKQRLPDGLFAAGGPPRLALVTCGGTFHKGVYSHNVVVYAEPVG
ncbi:class F sortase [Actinoplanes sp. NPDC051633]|uniref:class F sortase n=1 Tax=Actinoplanes sp. NPDC051633 TaxID=3155670 RepID=UPI00343B4C5A